MANGRSGKHRRDTQRDGVGFTALPSVVLDSHAYLSLSHPAKALLVELARQLGRDNNGRLLATTKVLGPRGWRSNDVITRALRELASAGLIHQTVKGQRPSRAAWYAVTWYALADLSGYDAGTAQAFQRGAYMNPCIPHHKNTSLTPSGGVERSITAPSPGVESERTAPSGGAVMGVLGTSPTPRDGDHLDIAICTRRKAKQDKGKVRPHQRTENRPDGQRNQP